MSNTQAQMQRRLGRLSMVVDILERELGAQDERIRSMKREIELIKELSMRLVEMPRSAPTRAHHQNHHQDGRRRDPAV